MLAKRLILFLLSAALLLCGGCMSMNIDSLLSLPQLSEEFLDLQSKIDDIISSGANYSAPTSGSYRQSVQMFDLNGDGHNEALAFFNITGEKPLKIYVFRMQDGHYEPSVVIEGDGSDIESISYSDMDGDGWTEIIVGWKMGADIKMLNVYSLKSFVVSSIAATDFTEYMTDDIDENGKDELLVIRKDSTTSSSTVTMYSLSEDGEMLTSESRLSLGAENIDKLITGHLSDGKKALFVESAYSGTGLITDIFLPLDGRLTNISADTSGVSTNTLRYYSVYCRDINGDGVMEVPLPRELPAQGDTNYRELEWMSFSSQGTGKVELTTYHNYSDRWYIVLPDSWVDCITVRREDSAGGERVVVFSRWNGENKPVTDLMRIYALSGENRGEAATRGNRQLLRREDETNYAAQLLITSEEWSQMIDFQYLRDNFFMIYSEWVTGLT